MQFPEHSTCAKPIWDFLGENRYPWMENPYMLLVNFRVVGEQGTYKIVSIGRRHSSLISILSTCEPSKYAILDGIGGLMGVLMDMSVLFSMHEVEVSQKGGVLEYTVWLTKVEAGRESNIDADMVEMFSRKVCSHD